MLAGLVIVFTALALLWMSEFKTRHNLGMPMTIHNTQDTYIVCLDCGQEFDYDLKAMKVGKPRARICDSISSSGITRMGNTVAETEKRRPEADPDLRNTPVPEDPHP